MSRLSGVLLVLAGGGHLSGCPFSFFGKGVGSVQESEARVFAGGHFGGVGLVYLVVFKPAIFCSIEVYFWGIYWNVRALGNFPIRACGVKDLGVDRLGG